MRTKQSNNAVEERAERLKHEAEHLEQQARAQNGRFTLLIIGLLGIAVVCMFIYC